jgi:phenylacetate-CoA ligase
VSHPRFDSELKARLDQVLHVARRAPFSAERLARARASEWFDVPFLTKEDMRAAYPFGLLAAPRSQIASYHESTGTSGEPTASYFTEGDWEDVASRFCRNAMNLAPGDAVLVKTPYAMATTAHQMHRAARRAGAMVVPADNRSTVMSYPRVLRLLRDVPVTVAWCMPTEALLWAEAARRTGAGPSRDFPSLRAFVVAGEPSSFEKRRRIAELWNARVFEDYGSTETGSLAGECEHGALHLWADRFYFELRDSETGAVSREGRGELVVTSLFREAMPLVRYLLGDIVDLSHAPCPCGAGGPTVRVCGRAMTAFEVSGQRLFPVDVEAAVYALPKQRGVLFYRAQCRARALHVEFEVNRSEAAAAQRELTEAITVRAGVRAEVRAVPTGHLVPDALFAPAIPFAKPRFVFAEHEDWSKAIAY